jgi:Periplasmic lysozyme inhibitor of I-type lysozyme
MQRFNLGVCACLVTCAAAAADADRYARATALPDGQTVVVAEGDLEARSIGTYSVRLYRDSDLTSFESGLIVGRDGTIEDVRVVDLDGKGREQLVVIVRSAGTGGYVSAQAFAFDDGRIQARSKVTDLPKDADAIAAMTKTTKSDQTLGKGKYHGPTEGVRY